MGYERDNVARMQGYAYGEQPADTGVVKLNTNENPFPPSPAVAMALAAFDVADLRRYPKALADSVRSAAGDAFGVDAEDVVVTNGGDEGLRLAITTFVDPSRTFGMASPSYSLYPVLVDIHGCRIADVPLEADWTPPSDFASKLNGAGVQLACLVNPHAPSGALLSANAIATIAESLDGVLLVDEAYVDFVDPGAGHDLTPLIAHFDNLLLLRTLSKGYSLAGLRVGFLIGCAGLIEPIRDKTRDSYNVDALSQSLAEAALTDQPYARQCWQAVRAERRALTGALRSRGFHVGDSQANFILAEPPGPPCPTAAELFSHLRTKGVFVRYFDQPRLRDCLRITVGAPEENARLLEAVDAIRRRVSGPRPVGKAPLT